LIPNLSLVAAAVYLLGSKMLGFLLLFAPDFSWIALISGGFAGIWAFLRTGLILKTLCQPQPKNTGVENALVQAQHE
jgi:hypothetical protein